MRALMLIASCMISLDIEELPVAIVKVHIWKRKQHALVDCNPWPAAGRAIKKLKQFSAIVTYLILVAFLALMWPRASLGRISHPGLLPHILGAPYHICALLALLGVD